MLKFLVYGWSLGVEGPGQWQTSFPCVDPEQSLKLV
jgi:hypothetical protein